MNDTPKTQAAPPNQNRPSHDSQPAELAATQRTNESILLRSGYVLACNQVNGEDVLSVTGRDGQMCLRMTLGADGPVVEMQAQSLRLAAAGELRLDCERLELNAREQITLRSANLTEVVDRNIEVRAGGTIQSEAHAQQHRARRGNIELSANDDVALNGEQIRLNSPKPSHPTATWPLLSPSSEAALEPVTIAEDAADES